MADPRRHRAKLRGWRRRVWFAARRPLARGRGWARRNLPPGVRLLAGVALMVGGVFGFLPVVGFWMFPLGVVVAALDIRPIWRWLRGRRR